MRLSVRVPEEHGGTGDGCYKFDAKAFTLLSLFAMIEAVGLVIWRGHLLNHWTSAHCPAVCSILAILAVGISLLALVGYILAFVSASQYCVQVRSASR